MDAKNAIRRLDSKASGKKRKMVFIEPAPPSANIYTGVPVPRLGCLALGTIASKLGFEVSVIIEAMLAADVTIGDIQREVASADIVCVSATTSTAPRAYEVAANAKVGGQLVIMGGPHVTFLPDEALRYSHLVLRGECEETFPLLLAAVDDDQKLETVPGLSWRGGSGNVHNPDGLLPSAEVLNLQPPIDYQLIWGCDLRGGVLSVSTARGCPFPCTFCSVRRFNGTTMRYYESGKVLEEMLAYWKEYHPRYIFFNADNFSFGMSRAKEILRGMIELGIRPRLGFGCQVRHDVRDPEFLDLLCDAGVDRVMVGYESINEASLKLVNKRETAVQVAESIDRFHRHGIGVHGMFVGGFNTDTAQTFKETLEFVLRHQLDSFQMMLITPNLGSDDWDSVYQCGDACLTRDWAKYDGHHMVVRPKQISPAEANRLALGAMEEFYKQKPRSGRKADLLFRHQMKGLMKWRQDPEMQSWLRTLDSLS